MQCMVLPTWPRFFTPGVFRYLAKESIIGTHACSNGIKLVPMLGTVHLAYAHD